MLPAGNEDFHEKAADCLEQLMAGRISLIVPDLFWIETSNLIWRSVRYQRISKQDGLSALKDLRLRSLETVSSFELLDAGVEIALTHQRTVYDGIYVALAKDRDTFLVTADEKLANAIGAHYSVKWLAAL